jgi:phosphatidylserine/phosphatidylglycerophosphate/cardiolipin synthase-like enzyme
MHFKWTIILGLLLAACSGAPPNSAVTEEGAEPHVGKRRATTPLAAITKQYDIQPPDPQSATPLLEQLERELAKSDPNGRFRGVTFQLTRGNSLAPNWIVQTPNSWGRRGAELPFYPLRCKEGQSCAEDVALPFCSSDADCGGGTCGTIWPAAGSRERRKVCLGHSAALIDRLHGIISGARRSVDITLLQPFPDGRFLAALRAGLAELAQLGRQVEVRILIGQHPPDGVDAAPFLEQLGIANTPLRVSVAAMRSCFAGEECDGFSWNHAKIVSVDGRVAMVGGHNLWSEDYLIDRPVHDLSMVVNGPAAAAASRFADRMWRFVCDKAKKERGPVQLVSTTDGCPREPGVERSAAAGGIDVLAIGRLGVGITRGFGNHSELARDLLFGAARKTIRIAQQDIGFRLGRADTLFPETALEHLVDFMEKGGDVYIVLSNPGALGNTGSTYTNDVPVDAFARRLHGLVSKRFERLNQRGMVDQSPRLGPDPVNALLCNRVHLAPFRFGPDDKWLGGATFALHAKFYMIDDRVFYVGSDNMYPVNLQEFGYIVDDRRAAQELLDAWWNPMWQASRRVAVSGEGVPDCVFRKILRS